MVYRRLDNGSWSQYMKSGLDDESSTDVIGFSRNNSIMYMVDSHGRDTSALTATNMTTGKMKVLAETTLADINRVMMHPTQSTPEVTYYIYDRKHFSLLNKSLQKDFDFLETVDSVELDVYWRTLNDKKWFVLYARDNGSYRHYEYDRGAKKVKYLFSPAWKAGGPDPLSHELGHCEVRGRPQSDCLLYPAGLDR